MENIKVLVNEEEIDKRTKELADELYKVYGDSEVAFVITLKGACPFAMKLATYYKGDCTFEFIRVSSYQGEQSTGVITLKYPLKEENIRGKHALIIEDIVDTGYTLDYLRKYVKDLGATDVKEVTLLNKKSRRVVDIVPTYVGFEIDDLFVLGFGLDYDEKLRNLPFVGYIEK